LPTCVALWCLLILLPLVGEKPAPAQTPAQIGNSTIALTGPWKFQIGDSPLDPATHRPLWADPSFDDSRWETVDLTPNGSADPFTGDRRYVPGWTSKGHPNYSGYAWYRIRARIQAPKGTPIALATFGWVDGADDGYQVFSDGNLVGSWGDFRNAKDPTVYFTQPATFSLIRASGAPQQITIALRFWMSPVRLAYHPFVGGLHYAPLLGETSAVNAAAHISLLHNLRTQAFPPFDVGLGLFMVIIVASLVFFDRSDPVYLWVAGALLLDVINELVFALANFTQLVSLRMFFAELQAFSQPLILGAWGMVWWLWFQRKPAWAPKALAIGTCIYATVGLFGHDLLYEFMPHSVSAVFNALSFPCALFLIAMMLVIVGSGVRTHGREGWFVIPAVVFLIIAQLQGELIKLHFHGWVNVHGVQLFYSNIANLLNLVAISVLLVRRLLQSLQRQRETAVDIKNAQEVQQVILPEARTVLPGLVIESEYRPAREVGGDFFQIIPNDGDDSLLIVAGDVTGKGLKAGMLVALLVGALRSTADENNDPAYILKALNRRLAGRADAQATCLALRIAKDGRVDLANAGHLAPYLNGVPLPMEGALPLGIIEALEPSSMQFHLKEDDKLVLVSDGTAEATNVNGELFGFDRLQNLISSSSNAVEVAAAAQAFGQEDDISVISITRTRTVVLTPALA
jgi:hypothetical protein